MKRQIGPMLVPQSVEARRSSDAEGLVSALTELWADQDDAIVREADEAH